MWKNILLTRVLKASPETFTTSTGFKIRKRIKPWLRPVLRAASGCRMHIECYPELEKEVPYIFASTHFFVDDVITNYACIDRSAYMLIGTPDQVEHNPMMYAAWINGMIFVDKVDPKSRKDAVEKMVRVLKNNTSVILYPEGAWNNTENLLVQPLFASPWILAQRTGCKVVPVSMYHEYKSKDIYYRAGNPVDLCNMEKKDALEKLRDTLATMTYEMMEDHSQVITRKSLGQNPRQDFIDERMREYLCTKWTRDDWDMEITIYRDKQLSPTPEAVRADFDRVEITADNAPVIVPIWTRRKEDQEYDLVQYMKKNWKKHR